VVKAAREVVGEELLGGAKLVVGSGNNRRRLPPAGCSWRKTGAGNSRCSASLVGTTCRFSVQEGRGDEALFGPVGQLRGGLSAAGDGG
jgi:hypothetical protein